MKTACYVFFLAVVMSCSGPTQKQKAFDVFNEGVAFSLKAQAETDVTKAAGLERQAIQKYEHVLTVDSTHGLVRSTMGHSYYLLNDYAKAIKWFETSNQVDTASASSYRELGICKIALNELETGWNDLHTAFHLESISGATDASEIKKITADELDGMGRQAFEYGETYETQGEADKATGFKEYGMNILFMAYEIESSRKDIAKAIAERAEKMGDTARHDKYFKLSK